MRIRKIEGNWIFRKNFWGLITFWNLLNNFGRCSCENFFKFFGNSDWGSVVDTIRIQIRNHREKQIEIVQGNL